MLNFLIHASTQASSPQTVKMEGLLAEISAKRKVLGDEPGGVAGAKKYMRRADLERAKEEEEKRRKEEAEAKKLESRTSKMRKDVSEPPHR